MSKDYDIERIVQTLRSVADYLIAVKTTADELRGHGVSVGVDLDDCLDRAEQLQEVATELVVAKAQREAIVIITNPPFSGGVS